MTEPSQEARELAQKISENCIGHWDAENCATWRTTMAHELIQAALDAAYERGKREAVPEGWLIVPKVPSAEMLQSAFDTYSDNAEVEYKAMIAAAPKLDEGVKK